MALKHTTGDALAPQSEKITELGSYHLLVTEASETPVNNFTKTLIPNAKFQLMVEVLDGTHPGQKGKIADLTFFHPRSDAPEFGKLMDQIREDRLWLALGLLPVAAIEDKGGQLGLKKGVAFEIDLQQAVGRQFVAKFADKDKDEKYIAFNRLEASHVDAPAVAAIPKNAEALKLIDPKLRWVGGRPAGVSAAPVPASVAAPAAATPALATAYDDV